jgi:hypothetical protein
LTGTFATKPQLAQQMLERAVAFASIAASLSRDSVSMGHSMLAAIITARWRIGNTTAARRTFLHVED